MGVNRLLIFGSSRSKPRYLEVYGGLLVYIYKLMQKYLQATGRQMKKQQRLIIATLNLTLQTRWLET